MLDGCENLVKYKDLLAGIASSGYVVIASKSGRTNFCKNETEDQLHQIEWMKTAELYKDVVDWSVPVGIAGQSMGSMATNRTAANADGVAKHNIGAAYLINGVVDEV